MEANMLIVKVAISDANISFDKLYDYFVPNMLENDIKIGMRVLIPFGRGDRKIQGIVLKIYNQCIKFNNQKLPKFIYDILDDREILNDEMIKLAIWMRDRYFCTFFDSAKAMLPPGAWLDKTEYYTTNQNAQLNDISVKYSEICQSIINVLFNVSASESHLKDYFKISDISKELALLVRDNILIKSAIMNQRTKDKKTKIVSLAISLEEAKFIASKARTKIYTEILSQFIEDMDIKSLCHASGASVAQINAMVSKGIFILTESEIYRKPEYTQVLVDNDIILSEKQEIAYNNLSKLMEQNIPKCSILFGVTGSGKTLVYIKLIQDAIKNGKTAILMVPEISLTPQMCQKFLAYFGEKVAVVHSGLSVGERYDEYKRLRDGIAKVAIGTRSAVFAPIKNIGVIIMDEEQESSYKSENSPRFHALDIAKMRSGYNNSLLVLGSATPSVESFYYTKTSKYDISIINERYQGTAMPNVLISDMRESRIGELSIGEELHKEILQNIKNKQQTVLFVNRRGDSRNITCIMCAYTPECINCSTNMTYHSANDRVMCHYCGYAEKFPNICPICKSKHLKKTIAGTQSIENELYKTFPDIKVIRMDADTTTKKNAHDKIISSFGKGDADILLGTQMVTKGLDFENVTLVGVIDSDQALYAEEYKAAEKTFSLITQVIGRAGRRKKQGRAIIQTYNPNHFVILSAATQDYEKFFDEEIIKRQAILAPPFNDIATITGISQIEFLLVKSMIELKDRITSLLNGSFIDINVKIFGPTPAQVVRVNNKYIYTITIRGNNNKRFRELISGTMIEFNKNYNNRGINIFVDINP